MYKFGVEKFDNCHKNCSEIYCQTCDSYINHDYVENKNIQHTCYVKPVDKPPKWPRGIIAFDLETCPNGQANLVTAAFPKQLASPAGGVGLKIFSDFSLDDYTFPYPVYKVPANAELGEVFIQDNPRLGLPAMDISHKEYLYKGFPFQALIGAKRDPFETNEELAELQEEALLNQIDKEESQMRNFPEERNRAKDNRLQKVHPLNVHAMKDIQSFSSSKTEPSCLNKATKKLGQAQEKIDQQSGSRSERGNLKHLLASVTAVDTDQDFVSKAYALQDQQNDKEVWKEDQLFRQREKKKRQQRDVPSHVREFLNLEAEVSDSETSLSSYEVVNGHDQDSDSEEVTPCQLSKRQILSSSDSDDDQSEADHSLDSINSSSSQQPVSPEENESLITSSNSSQSLDGEKLELEQDPESPALDTISDSQQLVFHEQNKSLVTLNSLRGTLCVTEGVPINSQPADNDDESLQSTSDSCGEEDENEEVVCSKQCCNSSANHTTPIDFTGLNRHPEVPCEHSYEIARSVAHSENKGLHQFLRWLHQDQFHSFVCLAHFGSNFDLPVRYLFALNFLKEMLTLFFSSFQIVLRAAIELGYIVELTTKGNKILSFTMKGVNITFLDSYLFIPNSLRKMKDSFDLKSTSKGHFPFLFNDPRFYNLVMSHHPELDAYEINVQNPGNQNDLKEWWESNHLKPFHMRHDLVNYCCDDTVIQILTHSLVRVWYLF